MGFVVKGREGRGQHALGGVPLAACAQWAQVGERESLGVSRGVPPAFAGKSNEKHTQPMTFSWFLNYELLNAIFLMYSLS